MPNEMLPPKSNDCSKANWLSAGADVPSGGSDMRLDAQLARLAETLRRKSPPPSLETRVLHAARAQGLLLETGANDTTSAIQTKRHVSKPSGRRTPSRQLLGWGLAASAGIFLAAGLSLWMNGRQFFAAPVPPPLPGVARVETLEFSPSPLVAEASAPARTEKRTPVRNKTVVAREGTQTPTLAASTSSPTRETENGAERSNLLQASTPWAEEDFLGTGTRMHLAALPVVPPMPLSSSEPLQTLRVKVSAEDLWRMGFYAMPPTANRPVIADFLVGEDGRPLGVRVVGLEH